MLCTFREQWASAVGRHGPGDEGLKQGLSKQAESESHRVPGPMRESTAYRSAPFLGSTKSLLVSGVTLIKRGPIMTAINFLPIR